MNQIILFSSLAILLTTLMTAEAATPLFLQAITSALATIPFTGGPMTTGIVGAKLAVGTKLLYYLGYFGRRSKPKTVPAVKKIPSSTKSSSLPGGLQPLPLPYMFSGGGFPATTAFQPASFQSAAFQSSNFPSSLSTGIDPAQLFQVLTSYGVDPNLVMEAISNAGGMNTEANSRFPSNLNTGFGGGSNTGFEFNGNPFESGSDPNFGMNSEFGGNSNLPPNFGFGQNAVKPEQSMQSNPTDSSNTQPPARQIETPGGTEDVESFFTFLQDMDENTCISRLICNIGQDPGFLGDFSENIFSMVSSLSVEPSSRAYQYIGIMEKGKLHGQCRENFPECTDMAYDIVKSVAPSVGLPQNVDSEAINRL